MQVVLKQYFEGYQGGQLKVLDTETFKTGEGHSAIVTLDNPSGTSWSHTYIASPFYYSLETVPLLYMASCIAFSYTEYNCLVSYPNGLGMRLGNYSIWYLAGVVQAILGSMQERLLNEQLQLRHLVRIKSELAENLGSLI